MNRAGSVAFGIALVFIGIVSLMFDRFSLFIHPDRWWPLFVLLPGALMLGTGVIVGLSGARQTAALAIPGSIVTTVGLILLYANTTGHWGVWSFAWALIPAAIGVGIVISSLVGRTSGLTAGLMLAAGGLTAFVFFGSLFGGLTGGRSLSLIWPVLLIVMGGLLLVSGR